MKFGDIVLRKDELSGEEHLKWSTEMESKTRHGEENTDLKIWGRSTTATGSKFDLSHMRTSSRPLVPSRPARVVDVISGVLPSCWEHKYFSSYFD